MIPEVRANIEAHLDKHGVTRECGACGGGRMDLFPHRFLMTMDGTTDEADFFALMCPKCCHARFFSVRSPSLLAKWADHPAGWTEDTGHAQG